MGTILYFVLFGALVFVVEFRHTRMRSTWDDLADMLGRAESMEIEAWVPTSVPIGSGREQRREIMRRLGMTMVILVGLVLWHAFVVPPVRGEDVTTAAVTESPEEAAEIRGLANLLSGDAAAAERELEVPGDCWAISAGAEVPEACPPGVPAGTLIDASLEETAGVVTLEDDPPDDVPDEAMPIGETALNEDIPDDSIPPISEQPTATMEEELPAAEVDPDSDADMKEVMDATGVLIQAIKDKDALAITLGIFLILFAVFRLRPVRDSLGQWIPEKWYRVIPIGLAVVLGILVAIAAGGDPLGSVVKGLAGGGGIAVIYAAIVAASKKKAASDA